MVSQAQQAAKSRACVPREQLRPTLDFSRKSGHRPTIEADIMRIHAMPAIEVPSTMTRRQYLEQFVESQGD